MSDWNFNYIDLHSPETSVANAVAAVDALVRSAEAYHIQIKLAAKGKPQQPGLFDASTQQATSPNVVPTSSIAPPAPVGQAGTPTTKMNPMGQRTMQLLLSLTKSMEAMQKATSDIVPVLQKKKQLHQTIVQQFQRIRQIFGNVMNGQISKRIGLALQSWWRDFSTIDFQKADPAEVAQRIGSYIPKLNAITSQLTNFSGAKSLNQAAKGITQPGFAQKATPQTARTMFDVQQQANQKAIKNAPQQPQPQQPKPYTQNDLNDLAQVAQQRGQPNVRPSLTRYNKPRRNLAHNVGHFYKMAQSTSWGWQLA